MGINGKRLSEAEMNARGYTMTISELQILISLPVGGPDGHYKVGQCCSGGGCVWYISYKMDCDLKSKWAKPLSKLLPNPVWLSVPVFVA